MTFTQYRNDNGTVVMLDGSWKMDAVYQENDVLWHDQNAPKGTTCAECGTELGHSYDWTVARCADPATAGEPVHCCDAVTYICIGHVETVDAKLSEHEKAAYADKALTALVLDAA